MKRIVPGIHSVQEVLRVRPRAITELWIREGALRDELEEIERQAQKHKIKIRRSGARSMDHEAPGHQGVVATVEGAPEWLSQRELNALKSGLILAVDGLEDPQNLGNLMRSAWQLGAIGVMTTADRSAGFTPSSQKVASGAFEHVPLMEATNLHAELLTLKDAGFWVYGLSEEAKQPLYNVEMASKTILLVGSEHSGLRKPSLSACDDLIKIPFASGAQVFNAAVAGAIAGYEFTRQRALSENRENSRK